MEQTYKLNMIPTAVPVVVRVSQYDIGLRTITFNLLNGSEAYEVPSGSTVTVRGVKTDATAFEYACTYSGSTVTFDIQEQMTVLAGKEICEIRITNDGEILGSANFVMFVENGPINEDTPISETDLPLIEQAVQAAAEIIATAETVLDDWMTSEGITIIQNWTQDWLDEHGITYDSALSSTSENAVQNKVITENLETKAEKKYDDTMNVINVAVGTTMGDIVTQLASVNTAGDHVVFDVSALNAGMYLCTIYTNEGYYRIADLVTGFEGTGFYLDTDLLADIIKSGSQSTGKHYTVQFDQVTAQMTRLNDAASITTDTTNFKHSGSVNANYNNPFDDIYPWSGRKLCNIDIDLYRGLTSGASIEDCVTAWEDDANFSYTDQYGVWVYTPPFYGRSYILGNYRYFDVTDENLQNNIYYPASIVGRWLGVDTVLTIDGTSKHCNLPTVGVPMNSVSGTNMHTYAKNYGASLNDIYRLDAVSLLYFIEYANANIQDTLGNGVSDLYRQSSDLIKANVTNSNVVQIENATAIWQRCVEGAEFDIGTSNGGQQVGKYYIVSAVQNGTLIDVTLNEAVTVTTANYWSIHGLANIPDADIGSKSGYIGTNGRSNAYYRGQTFYANRFQYILGIFKEANTQEIYVTSESETDNYDALDTSAMTDTGLAIPTSAGYVKTFGMAEGFSFLPVCIETGTGAYGDYFYTANTTSNRCLWFGGASNDGGACGFYGNWSYASSRSGWPYAACPRLKTPS